FEPDDSADATPRPLGGEDLERCRARAVAATGTGTALSCAEIRVSSQIVARRTAGNAGGHDFLNSFIAEDLGLVAERAAKGDAGTALREYLRPGAEIRVAD